MFERFTDRARRVVVLAQEEARLFKHAYIGTEHFLLGLLREDEGVGARALTGLGLDLGKARIEVERRVGAGTDDPKGHIPFTPRAKEVLELSLRQALQLGHNYIGTEHLLLALVNEGEGVAAQILLTEVAGGLERVRDEVFLILRVPQMTVETVQGRGRSMRHISKLVRDIEPNQDVIVRLEAIEARLSAIEALLRAQGEEREAQ